jgi:hypothetical protein
MKKTRHIHRDGLILHRSRNELKELYVLDLSRYLGPHFSGAASSEQVNCGEQLVDLLVGGSVSLEDKVQLQQ